MNVIIYVIDVVAIISVFFMLTACGGASRIPGSPNTSPVPTVPAGQTGSQGPVGPMGPAGAVVVITSPVPSAVPLTPQSLVSAENTKREALGQDDLMQGMACTLYTVPTTTTGITATANGGTAPVLTNVGSFGYNGQFNQLNASVSTGFNVLPLGLQQQYETWFITKCTGTLFVATDAWHSFSLTSDDGSNLYLSGLLINNDGLHAAATVSASKFLQYGMYSFELDFFQGAGMQELVLDEDGTLFDTSNIYH